MYLLTRLDPAHQGVPSFTGCFLVLFPPHAERNLLPVHCCVPTVLALPEPGSLALPCHAGLLRRRGIQCPIQCPSPTGAANTAGHPSSKFECTDQPRPGTAPPSGLR